MEIRDFFEHVAIIGIICIITFTLAFTITSPFVVWEKEVCEIMESTLEYINVDSIIEDKEVLKEFLFYLRKSSSKLVLFYEQVCERSGTEPLKTDMLSEQEIRKIILLTAERIEGGTEKK